LFFIVLLNLVILAGIVRVFTSMRRGTYGEAELERQLANRGFFYRFFGRWMRAITKEWQMYPVGVVFGLGFDTATEVALLATTALLASQHIPWYAILCLPILFTAGMTVSRRHANRVDIDPAHQVGTGGRRRRRWRSSLPAIDRRQAAIRGGSEADGRHVAGHERIRAHHPDRMTATHSVRVEAGNDEGEPAARPPRPAREAE